MQAAQARVDGVKGRLAQGAQVADLARQRPDAVGLGLQGGGQIDQHHARAGGGERALGMDQQHRPLDPLDGHHGTQKAADAFLLFLEQAVDRGLAQGGFAQARAQGRQTRLVRLDGAGQRLDLVRGAPGLGQAVDGAQKFERGGAGVFGRIGEGRRGQPERRHKRRHQGQEGAAHPVSPARSGCGRSFRAAGAGP